MPEQIKFIRADLLIAVFAGTDQIFSAFGLTADNVDLHFLSRGTVRSPPLSDVRKLDWEIVRII